MTPFLVLPTCSSLMGNVRQYRVRSLVCHITWCAATNAADKWAYHGPPVLWDDRHPHHHHPHKNRWRPLWDQMSQCSRGKNGACRNTVPNNAWRGWKVVRLVLKPRGVAVGGGGCFHSQTVPVVPIGQIWTVPASGKPPPPARGKWILLDNEEIITLVHASVVKGCGDCPASCMTAVTTSCLVSAQTQEIDFTSPALKLLYITRLLHLDSLSALSHSHWRATEGSAEVQFYSHRGKRAREGQMYRGFWLVLRMLRQFKSL